LILGAIHLRIKGGFLGCGLGGNGAAILDFGGCAIVSRRRHGKEDKI
jgi:hypothetical protein